MGSILSRVASGGANLHRSPPRLLHFEAHFCCGLAQDLKNGYYQELIAFILFLNRQTKAAFDFSSSAGGDKQCVVGGGFPIFLISNYFVV